VALSPDKKTLLVATQATEPGIPGTKIILQSLAMTDNSLKAFAEGFRGQNASFSPDGKLLAYRKGSDGFLATPLWGQEPGIYVLTLATGKAKKVSKSGQLPQFGKTGDRVFFVDQDGDNQVFKSVTVTGAEPVTHFKATNAGEFALSPDEQFIGWTERYQAYVMPFARSGRTIDVAADAKALPQSRISSDAGDYLHWSGDSSTLYWTQGPDLYARRVDASAFDGAKAGPVPPVSHLGFVVQRKKRTYLRHASRGGYKAGASTSNQPSITLSPQVGTTRISLALVAAT